MSNQIDFVTNPVVTFSTNRSVPNAFHLVGFFKITEEIYIEYSCGRFVHPSDELVNNDAKTNRFYVLIIFFSFLFEYYKGTKLGIRFYVGRLLMVFFLLIVHINMRERDYCRKSLHTVHPYVPALLWPFQHKYLQFPLQSYFTIVKNVYKLQNRTIKFVRIEFGFGLLLPESLTR